ncbi:hypothetical protein AgCh_022470 [Apium graveolens]
MKQITGGHPLEHWKEKTLFLGQDSYNYFGGVFLDGLRNQLEVEFLELKQDERRSVLEYEAKFAEFARFIPEYVSVEIQKVALVMEGNQRLTVKDESDKKRNSEGVKDKENQGESTQGFENRFGRNRGKIAKQSVKELETMGIEVEYLKVMRIIMLVRECYLAKPGMDISVDPHSIERKWE